MAQSEILGLFGSNPQQLRNEYAASGRISPAQMGSQGLLQQVVSMGGNAGANIGTALGGLLGGKAPGEAEAAQFQDALAQVNQMNLPSTYEKYKAMSGLLSEKGQAGAAMAMAAEAEKLKPKAAETTKLSKLMQEQSRFPEGSPQWNAYQGAIDKETQQGETATKLSTYGRQLADAGYDPKSPEFQQAMKVFNEATLEGKAKGSGVSIVNEIPGTKKAADVPKFRQDVINTVKPYTQSIDAADNVITAIDLGIKEGNFAAARGAAVSLIKAFGDNQISRAEATEAGADPSIIGGGIDYVNRLFTGTPSVDTMNKIKQTAEALKKLNKNKRGREIDVQKAAAKLAGYNQSDIDNIFSGFDEKPQKTIVNTGVDKKTGRRVNKYSDGSVEYAN